MDERTSVHSRAKAMAERAWLGEPGAVTDLIRLTHGVYRATDSLTDDAARAAALLSVCPPGSVLAGVAAARVHELWLPDTRVERVDVVLRGDAARPRYRAGCRRREIRGRRRSLRSDEIQIVQGVPATSAARTWVDLAEQLSLADLVAAGDSVLRGSTTEHDIDAVLRRGAHRRGIVRARLARDLLDRRSRSRPESHLRVALVRAGLPAPAVNVAVFSDTGEWIFEPDLGYADARLAIEYNGALHADPNRMRRDISRELDGIVRGGWRTVTFGPVEVFQRPDQVAAIVARLRLDRMPRLIR